MALNIPLAVVQSNLIMLSFQITQNDQPFNLTGCTLKFILKASAGATDVSGLTLTPSITSEPLGEGMVTIPYTDIATSGNEWYRLDVIDGEANPVTALMGSFTVIAA
jgi:hypothetical protein